MEEPRPELRDERPLGELLGDLSRDMTLLLRQEVQLAKTEIGEKVGRATRDLVSLAVGGMVAWAGVLALVTALIIGLADLAAIDAWLSALIVGAILAIVGLLMVRGGVADLKRVDPTPRRTAESLQEDVRWAKEQLR
ncbi:MAG TPA: phage holin family protein [Gemmatimonadales bacterium]|nr:phage holin family protein [Gemmatimonadales bacterium]